MKIFDFFKKTDSDIDDSWVGGKIDDSLVSYEDDVEPDPDFDETKLEERD